MISKYPDFLKSEAFLAPLDIPTGTQLEFTVLGQGEYNLNYVFSHPVTGKKLVLRINTGSQMHLDICNRKRGSKTQGILKWCEAN